MTSVDLGWLEIERARYETLLDSLTGLPRWGLLIDRTSVAIARAKRAGKTMAVFVLDDPHFPDPPHDVLAVVKVLQGRLRPDDTLARIGDRRFAVVCNDIDADEDAALVARRLVYASGLVSGLGVALANDDDPPELVIGNALLAAVGRGQLPAV
ncbi:MAG TPA: GGDEF domain-containing protein [Acidimicrobiia bacterium]|nr:GGDEF domain-containing protein [Acidimicrobiia bacterium]